MCENCNRIESSQCHIFFGWFSQGKSNDWKEIWLELYLEGINCQSNVPNPWPELIYLRRSGKPGRKSQIHKVHPKWGLSRGRLMIPIRELGSGIGDRIAGSGTADEPFDRLSVSQSVNWHFLPPFHFISRAHRQSNQIIAPRPVDNSHKEMPMPIPPFLPTQLRYCYKNIVSATRAKIAKITELKSLLPLRLLLLPFIPGWSLNQAHFYRSHFRFDRYIGRICPCICHVFTKNKST